jgi:hypothetical protein
MAPSKCQLRLAAEEWMHACWCWLRRGFPVSGFHPDCLLCVVDVGRLPANCKRMAGVKHSMGPSRHTQKCHNHGIVSPKTCHTSSRKWGVGEMLSNKYQECLPHPLLDHSVILHRVN